MKKLKWVGDKKGWSAMPSCGVPGHHCAHPNKDYDESDDKVAAELVKGGGYQFAEEPKPKIDKPAPSVAGKEN